jgi:hypothetical protein
MVIQVLGMSKEKKVVMRTVQNLMPRVVEHMAKCLVFGKKINDPNVAHWKVEMFSWISRIQNDVTNVVTPSGLLSLNVMTGLLKDDLINLGSEAILLFYSQRYSRSKPFMKKEPQQLVNLGELLTTYVTDEWVEQWAVSILNKKNTPRVLVERLAKEMLDWQARALNDLE